jgi:class I fructose-bisphosphate aldolase
LLYRSVCDETGAVRCHVVRAIRDGGGFGSIIGRNSFQRKKPDALKLLDQIMKIYSGQAQ